MTEPLKAHGSLWSLFCNVLGACTSLDVYSEYLNSTSTVYRVSAHDSQQLPHQKYAWPYSMDAHCQAYTRSSHPTAKLETKEWPYGLYFGVPATAFQLTCIQACSNTQPPVCHGCRSLLTVLLCLCRARSAVSPWRTELSLNYHRAQPLGGTHCGSESLTTFWPQRAYLPPSS